MLAVEYGRERAPASGRAGSVDMEAGGGQLELGQVELEAAMQVDGALRQPQSARAAASA